MRWSIACTPFALHALHIDSNGFNTIVRVETGGKLWVFATPKSGSFADFGQVDMYDEKYDMYSLESDKWDFHLLVLGPGDTLGGHFYCTPTLKDSVFGLYHHFASDLTVTNTEHDQASLETLTRILAMIHRDLVEERDDDL
ncbi:hypothetical protein H0H93_001412, partial [Arthromyces matolae]